MPRPHPPEFRERAINLARQGDRPIDQIASDIGVSGSCLRGWLRQANVDAGNSEGLTTEERDELRRLRKENRVLQMERDILKKAAAFFANENVNPK